MGRGLIMRKYEKYNCITLRCGAPNEKFDTKNSIICGSLCTFVADERYFGHLFWKQEGNCVFTI